MPLFSVSSERLLSIEQTNFTVEKELQKLVEANLETIFNCRFVATEFSTGQQHAGRIDTLGLSEDNNPVIVEYKKVESSELITQSLYYLSWIHDHKGDFEVAVQKALGSNAKVDWSVIRVICIAPNYKKFDLHAVQVIGENIELWTYRLFANQTLYFEEILQKSYTSPTVINSRGKNPVMVAAGKKAAQTRETATYTFEQHLTSKPQNIQELARSVQEFIMGIDSAIEEMPRKLYVAYRTTQNIAYLRVSKEKLSLHLKLNPEEVSVPDGLSKTASGYSDKKITEMFIKSQIDLEAAKPFIEMAYRKVGG